MDDPPSHGAGRVPDAGARSGLALGLLLGLGPGAALGVGRFAYALVLPAMQAGLGLGYAAAGLLGSANTAGYLVGALVSHRLLAAAGYRKGVYVALVAQTLTLAAMAAGGPFAWLALLRFAQGLAGAFVFVGGAALLLASGGRGVATGMYFGGVGVGIVLSPLILGPALPGWFPGLAGWRAGWLAMALLAAAMTALAALPARRLIEPERPAPGRPASLRTLRAPLVAYGLYGAGYIGYMTFVTTGLAVPVAPFWLLLGLGATLTGLAWGPLVDRLGGARTLRLVLACLSLASLPPLLVRLPWLSAFLFGISFLGVITAITDLFRRRLPASAWGRAMGLSTAAFAAGQAVGPTLAGWAGEWVGGPGGALGLASALLLAGLAIAFRPLPPRRETRA